jgi:hypothetical protein
VGKLAVNQTTKKRTKHQKVKNHEQTHNTLQLLRNTNLHGQMRKMPIPTINQNHRPRQTTTNNHHRKRMWMRMKKPKPYQTKRIFLETLTGYIEARLCKTLDTYENKTHEGDPFARTPSEIERAWRRERRVPPHD